MIKTKEDPPATKGGAGEKNQPKTSADYALQIQQLEEEIASLTVKISQTERDIEQKEIESLSLLKKWTENKDNVDEKERTARIEKIRDICDKERTLDKAWEDLRRERDGKIRDLRQRYLDYIKTTHQERDLAKKKGNVDVANVKAPPGAVAGKATVTLHNSSLVTGTSQAGVDDIDYHRIFKKWEFSFEQLSIDEKKEKNDEVLSTKGPTFLVQQGTLLNKEVCIKTFILNDEAAMSRNKLMQTEYKRMKEQLLGHPNLLAPIGYIPDTSNHKMAIIVELARNKVRSLQDVLSSLAFKSEEKRIKLGFQRKLYIAKCVTAALSWLHENLNRAVNSSAIVHSRLKPSNILFTRDWKVKVSDYGIGLPQNWLPTAGREDILFNERYAHYSAPELFTENPQSTPASDAWALGMIFYTLLTDKIPYHPEATNYKELAELIKKKTPTLPENTPPEFRDIIMKCWDSTPAARRLPKDIAESDPWARIFQQASLHGKEEAKKIWDRAVKGDASVQSVNWGVLGPIFWETFKYPKVDQPKENCIKHLIRVAPNGDVTFEKFSAFASTFSPFRVGDLDGPAYISDLISLCKEKWFYGLKARGETEALLNSDQAKKLRKEKKFPFLVRLSDNKGYQFCISYIGVNSKTGKDEVLNLLILPEQYENEGFLPHLRNEIKKKKLEPLVHPERPFDFLLDATHKPLKMKASTNATGGDNSFLGWSASLSATGSGKYIT